MTGIILCKRVMRFFQNRDVAAFPQSEVYGPFVCHSLLNPFSKGLYLNAQGVYDLPEKKNHRSIICWARIVLAGVPLIELCHRCLRRPCDGMLTDLHIS